MHWPWKRRKLSDSFVASWSGQTLAYVRAHLRQDGVCEVLQSGVEQQGSDGVEEFVRRLQGLGLKGFNAHVMLRPEQYQLLQIDAPAVAPEEVRSAARWQIRDMVDMHMDDITLDVMRVGGGKVGSSGQLFVVVAGNAMLTDVLRLGQSLQWNVPVVDIQETAQRNLQTMVAQREGRVERAHAALMLVNEHQVLLTISANGELYYTRRIDLGSGFTEKTWGHTLARENGEGGSAPTNTLEYAPAPAAGSADDDVTQRFVVEVQRSLDVWDHTWSDLPLDGLWVEVGARTGEMAAWLSQELGFAVKALNADSFFPGFESRSAQERMLCLPLLGILLRTEERNL